jgi:sulfopyruvate decarboxylase subunit beta
MKRYDCLKIVADEMSDALVVCTVGGAAAEWNSIRPSEGNLRCRTLGLVSSIAMGLALTLPKRRIVGIDGDGALLMNACGLATLAWQSPANLTLLLFDNGIYEASGLRPTATSAGADLSMIGAKIESGAEYFNSWRDLPAFEYNEVENVYRFMRHIEKTEGKRVLPIPGPKH